MKKQRYVIAVIAAVVLAIASGWSLLDAAPQTANGSKSRTQMDQQTYNETYGAEQVIILGQIDTTPQTTNGSKSITQIAQQKYNPTYGANQVILSTSTGLQVPFTNISGLANSDLLVYDSTDAAWENREQSTLLHNNFGGLTTGDPHTQYQKETDFTAGSVLFRGAASITQDNDNLFWDNTNKRLGIKTKIPTKLLEISTTTANEGAIIGSTQIGNWNVLADYAVFGHKDLAGLSYGVLQSPGGKLFLNAATGNQITFRINNAEVMQLSSDAKFGINSTPAKRFEVLDTSGIQGRLTYTASTVYTDLGTGSTGMFNIEPSGGRAAISTAVPVATWEVDGSNGYNVSIVGTATYDILTTDNTIGVSYTDTGTVALTLPAASSAWNSTDSIGIRYFIKDLDCNASANNITISRNATPGTDTITTTTEGNASVVLSTDGAGIWIQAVSASEWAVF